MSIVLILFSLSFVSAEDISNSTATPSETVNVTGHSFDDVQVAVDNANSRDVISLDEGYYKINKKPIDIKKTVTVQGSKKGTVLDAKKLDSVFIINAPDITLKDLTIQNSMDSSIQLYHNEKLFDLTIINCTFLNNGNGDDGGIIFDANGGSLTVINSTFKKNTADYGGAIYSIGNLTVINSIFTDNVGTYEGGAIHFSRGTLNIEGSTFTNNRASKEDGGGAIFALGDSANITNSIFNNNYGVLGGAISSSCNLSISNSNFSSNSAKSAGSVYVIGYIDSDDNICTYLTIENCNFDKCSANDDKKSVYAELCSVQIDNSTFNSSSYEVYVIAGALNETNNTLNHVKFVESIDSKITPRDSSVVYASDDCFAVKVTTGSFYSADRKVKVVVYTSPKETYYALVDCDYPYAYFSLSKLPVGSYKVKIYLESKYFKADPVTTKLTVKKATTKVTANKLTAKYKKSQKFTVKVKHKKTDIPVKNVKVKIKVYTGKKYKTYTVKTDKKGVAYINTKKLSRGTHKVVITSGNKNYSISKTSSIRIK